MSDHRLVPAVVQHISDFLGFAVPVDRHAVGAEALRRMAQFDEGSVVAQHDADRVAGADAEFAQSGRRTRCTLHRRVARFLPRAADHAANAISAVAVLPKLSASARGRNTTKIVFFRPKRPRRPGIIVRYFNG